MSLLRRIERAQQGAEVPKPDATGNPDATALVPVPPTPRTPRGPRAPIVADRSDVLSNIRARLEDEVIRAYDQLLDVDSADVNARVEGIIDRLIAVNGFTMTRNERLGLIEVVLAEVTGLGCLRILEAIREAVLLD